jgi:predicted RNA-binding protein associated with RNAse of E/G family
LGYTVFERGDRFVEYFYTDRWYSVFAVHTAGTRALRGWYCNIARPAQISADEVAQVDLALDVWVGPDRACLVLDEDEFAALPLRPEEVAAARAAVLEIQDLAARGQAPFTASGSGVG